MNRKAYLTIVAQIAEMHAKSDAEAGVLASCDGPIAWETGMSDVCDDICMVASDADLDAALELCDAIAKDVCKVYQQIASML